MNCIKTPINSTLSIQFVKCSIFLKAQVLPIYTKLSFHSLQHKIRFNTFYMLWASMYAFYIIAWHKIPCGNHPSYIEKSVSLTFDCIWWNTSKSIKCHISELFFTTLHQCNYTPTNIYSLTHKNLHPFLFQPSNILNHCSKIG